MMMEIEGVEPENEWILLTDWLWMTSLQAGLFCSNSFALTKQNVKDKDTLKFSDVFSVSSFVVLSP